MSLLNNSPTFSYVSATGISVIYQDKLHMVQDFNTNKGYIYWNVETPTIFRASNTRPSTYIGQYLVLVNENGIAIEVPNEDIKVFYDGNSVENMTDRIFGIYETNKEFGDKFVAIEETVDGITTTVGQLKEEDKVIKENISSIEQKADEIELSVSEVTKEFGKSQLRDDLNASIIKLNSSIGLSKSNFNTYAKDDSISTDEKNKINAELQVITENKDKVIINVDKVVKVATDNGMTSEKARLESAKSALILAHDNLVTNMRNVISDNVITPSDRTLVISSYGNYNTKIVELQGVCDSIIVLGMGGSITEEFANIGIKSDGIKLEVGKLEDTTNGLTEEVSRIDQKADSINLEVSKKVNGNSIISAINMSPESIKISSSKVHITGFVTFSDLSGNGTTTINGANIVTGTINANKISGGTLSAMDRINFGGNTYITKHQDGMLISSYRMLFETTSFSTTSDVNIFPSLDATNKLSVGTNGRGLQVYSNGDFYAAKDKFSSSYGARSAFKVNGSTGDSMCAGDFFAVKFVNLQKYSPFKSKITENKPNCFDILDSLNVELIDNSLIIKHSSYDDVQKSLNPCLHTCEDEVGVDIVSVVANLIDCVKSLKNSINTYEGSSVCK